MCGIAGIVKFGSASAERGILEDMVDIQKHRGPDDAGFYLEGPVGLGHRRLSIIDLSKDARQPMPNEDSSLFIIHNGEIYNYIELKAELERLGHRFRTKSDTEVILHAYEEWQERCLGYFNGMWAFAILDLRKGILFCSRDRFGVKPFYYYMDDEVFIFASEIKAVLKHPKVKKEPNDRTIFSYLESGYGYMDISDETFFRGIRQLRPAHYMSLSVRDGGMFQKRYWDLDPGRKTGLKDEKDICGRFRELFRDAVRLRLRSDVPLGVSLSGGLDSTSIACIAAELLKGGKLEAFSSCFDEAKYDERQFIRPVLDKTKANANLIFTRPQDLFDEIGRIIWHQEEPYSTLSIFPQWYVMKLAREKGVKVLLTGQGGDETLGGYHKYCLYLFADLFASFKWGRALREVKRYRQLKGEGERVFNDVFRIMLSHNLPRALKGILRSKGPVRTPSFLNRDFAKKNSNTVFTVKRYRSILNNDLYNALKISPLPSLLHIDDRSSMAHSVESRAPFLDYRLVEYLFSLGPEYKIRDGMTKYILRQSLKGILPEEVRTRRDKMGFATPLEAWLKTALKGKVDEIMNSREFSGRSYFDHRKVLKAYDDFVSGRNNDYHAIWSWVNLELWFKKFID